MPQIIIYLQGETNRSVIMRNDRTSVIEQKENRTWASEQEKVIYLQYTESISFGVGGKP